MKMYGIKDVDSYISSAPEDAQPIMNEIRRVITSSVPGVDEGIHWGIPFYMHHGMLAGFAVYAHHVSFGFNDQLPDDVRAALEKDGYKTGSKTVQINFGQPVPSETIARIVKRKAAQNEAAKRA